jgi:dethiobiotin synthetase
VILVSRHYLGSINHTLLSVEALKSRNLTCAGIIFSGEENPSTESIIKKMTGLPVIGRIEQEPYFDRNVILEYADKFRSKLTQHEE